MKQLFLRTVDLEKYLGLDILGDFNMKIKRIILIMGILAFITIFALNASFAASNETIDKFKTQQVDTYNKKIITVDYVSKYTDKNYNFNAYLTFSVKKTYKSKYKIKSIKAQYYTQYGTITKSYAIKNKTKVRLNFKNGIFDGNFTVSYYTKGKIKNETVNMESKHKWKGTTYFYGKKSNINLKDSGYVTYSPQGAWYVTDYQKFTTTTKSKKYKLKTIKAFFFNPGGIELVKTYNAYGKNKLTTEIPGTYPPLGIGAFKIYYY